MANTRDKNTEYAIETFSLTKVFSDWWGRNKVRAVDQLNLQIRQNEVFGLLGPNGSGKTTTVELLLGLLHPTKGRALVFGGSGDDPRISARIGFLPEESYLYNFLNARETLDFYGRLFGLPAKVRKSRIETLLDMVGLKAVANRSIGTYSKGMARRIGLAQALINDPDLLILDEPTAGLDPIGTRQVKDLILKLAERGKTILLSSHLLADVEDVCDRIAILYGGKIQAQGHVKQLLQQTGKQQIITDSISDATIEKIKRIVEKENAQCVVSSPMDRLENFFIKTVVSAQKQAMPTSGAISTTEIGGFLSEKTVKKDILDKLVSSSVGQQQTENNIVAEKKVKKITTVPSEHQQELLKKLIKEPTGSNKPAKPQPVSKSETQKQETRESKADQVKKDVLEQLTDRSKPEKNTEGDTADA